MTEPLKKCPIHAESLVWDRYRRAWRCMSCVEEALAEADGKEPA